MEMDIFFQYEKSDVLQALRFHFMQRREIRIFRGILMALGLFGLLVFSLHLIGSSLLLALLLMLALLAVVFWFVLPLAIYAKSKTFQDTIRLALNSEGLLIRTQYSERHLSWMGILMVIETKDFILLYRDKKSFFLVPARAFKDSKQRVEFSSLLQSHIRDYRSQ